jgi:hypothetical protein
MSVSAYWLTSARNARSEGASFDGVVSRPTQYNKRIAPARCSWFSMCFQLPTKMGEMPNNLTWEGIRAGWGKDRE